MQKYIHIKALFFLGIFSLLLLHQIVPHLHHQHDVEHPHYAVANSDNHGHHHDVPEKENPEKGFLDFFLEFHVHSAISNEILVTHESSVKLIKVKKDVNASFSDDQYCISINADKTGKSKVYHPPNNYSNRYLSSLDSRGPPSLG